MGNPKFYYYPTPDGTLLHTVDLGEPLAEMFTDFEVDSSTAVALDGGMYRSTGVHRETVTIQRDRLKLGEELFVELQQLQNHLDRGFSVMFAADSDKTYCFPLSLAPRGGDHQIDLAGDPFRGITGGNLPSENDIIVIESQNPELLYEQHIVKPRTDSTPAASMSISLGGSVNIRPAIAFKQFPAFARHYRFYPILKRPQADIGKQICTNEHGRLFTLNIRLVVDYQALFSHHPSVGLIESHDPQWGDTVPEYNGERVFPADPDYSVNLDNSDPRWVEFKKFQKNLIDPSMYPTKPDVLD